MKLRADQAIREMPGGLGLESPEQRATTPAAAAAAASHRPPLQLTATREHLRLVFIARNVVLLALLAYVCAQLLRGASLGLFPWAAALFLLAALVNATTFYRLRQTEPVSHNEFLLQILADVMLIAAALHHSGGDASPLAVLNLVPLTIAAATLPWRHTAGVFLAVVLAHELVCVYLPSGAWLTSVDRSGDLVDLIAAGLIAYFVSSMAWTSRKHADLLRRVRENYLGQRHSADLGTLAAYAAHQLSSPLATIAVVVGDMRSGLWHADDMKRALDIVAREIQTCKEVSSRLLALVGYSRAEGGSKVAADRFLARIIDKCQLMQPAIAVECRQESSLPAPEIVAEVSLEHALLVLLNSAPGGSGRVEVAQQWDHERLQIRICRCEGDARGALTSAEQLDVLMARHTVDWFGGTIDEFPHANGWPCLRLSLPLTNLGAAAHAIR